jgi:hypothetical protein
VRQPYFRLILVSAGLALFSALIFLVLSPLHGPSGFSCGHVYGYRLVGAGRYEGNPPRSYCYPSDVGKRWLWIGLVFLGCVAYGLLALRLYRRRRYR